MAVEWVSFDDALAEADGKRRHLLLGNGFSIEAYNRFNYASLMAEARRLKPSVGEIFKALGEPLDFEQALLKAESLSDRDEIKTAFAETITHIHPRRDAAITRRGMESCAEFLSHFLRSRRNPLRGSIFTTNYDLMLYWVLVEHRDRLRCSDGFDGDGIWRPGQTSAVNVHYLHGGVHLYMTGSVVKNRTVKLKADRGLFESLVDGVRRAVKMGNLPIIISEGSSVRKVSSIRSRNYPSRALDRFWIDCTSKEDVLFIFGHALGVVDDHIIEFIGRGRIESIYISVFDMTAYKRVSDLVKTWGELRASKGRPPVKVKVFWSYEADVWGKGKEGSEVSQV